jgi:hypothetical protein
MSAPGIKLRGIFTNPEPSFIELTLIQEVAADDSR